MNKEEITQLKEIVAEEEKEKIDPNLEEDAIAIMAEGEGWRLMMKKANKVIVSLLEPIDSGDVTAEADLALIGANTLANAKALKVLRSFINQAETVKNARRQMAAKKAEESKTGA